MSGETFPLFLQRHGGQGYVALWRSDHAVGDSVLLQVARTLRARLRTSDGADELSPAELLVNADIAMHDAKRGRARRNHAAASFRPPTWLAREADPG